MSRFEGKVGFVSAGATGIGFACAQAIVDGGGKVMICARRENTLQEAVEQLGPNAAYVVCDVSDEKDIENAIAATVKKFGKLDYAVNSAGTGVCAPFLDMPTEQIVDCFNTNLNGTFYAMRAQGKAMRDNGGGSIVNISSIAGAITHPWMSAYCVAKAGVDMMTKCAADELGEFNIRVNSIEPGVVKTPMASMLSEMEYSRQEYLSNMPISRIGEPADIGAMAAFLLSDEASWVTGQVIAVDGGHTLRRGPNLVPMFKQFMEG